MPSFRPNTAWMRLLRATALAIASTTACPSDLPAYAAPTLEDSSAPRAVHYREFGATGDGKTDDVDAICRAHEFANQRGLAVKADDNATYYIGGKDRTALIQTDTDFGSARFIIDDSQVQNRNSHVFRVTSKLSAVEVRGVTSLKQNQRVLNASLPGGCLVLVSDRGTQHFIRYGANRNNGTAKSDLLLVDGGGKIDESTPIVWDFERITNITARPIDAETLTIAGGRFTTIANAAESEYAYYRRGIAIERSRVTVDGLEHRVAGEGDQGAPYRGFIDINRCAHVIVRNTVLTGRKTYRTIGAAGTKVSMGTYDISMNRAANVTLINCSQTNDVKDRRFWGIMGSNFCKNLTLDHCTLSRFDAHMGVANATIRNSTLGHAGVNAIGFGRLTIENSTLYGRTLVNLRPDYGSTWRGEFVIRNCVFVPACGRRVSASLIGGFNAGKHDFGYACSMPRRITIDSLHIDDSNHPEDYRGPAIFANFNKQFVDESYVEHHPYAKTAEVVLKNVTTASGKDLRLSENPVMFRSVERTVLNEE